MREFRIAVLPGDGIGREVMAPCLDLARYRCRASRWLQPGLRPCTKPAPSCIAARAWRCPTPRCARRNRPTRFCSARWACPRSAIRTAPKCSRISTSANGSISMPACARSGCSTARPTPLADPRAKDIDCVLVRESTEGLFASRTMTRREGNEAVFDTMRITRRTSERLFDVRVSSSRGRGGKTGRPGRVTCVDKANVIPSMAFFRSIFLECAARHPDIAADCAYVDAVGSQDGARALGVRRARHREHVRRHPVGRRARR